ncbi:hypothetical protein VLL09_04835 [Dehalococcoides mccartyi]|uniref:Tip attachment protein J domain-containing protein n=1 Tax=Dehalococcoides mccartyi TaxID=61435 RepID=A0AB38Z7Z3_9CHLR|nr:hypothetical protein [Dehalococcoides mccartyi]WRO06718.1 hypothetical protein VLL09_04835 [Dehalococcoides mccartyi]
MRNWNSGAKGGSPYRLIGTGESWSSLIAGEGNGVSDYQYPTYYYRPSYFAGILRRDVEGVKKWVQLFRSLLIFYQTMYLPGNIVIRAGRVRINFRYKTDDLGIAPSLNLYTATSESNNQAVAADYSRITNIPACDVPLLYEDIVGGSFHEFELNAAGIAQINTEGVTKYGIRCANYDVAGIEPVTDLVGDTWIENARYDLSVPIIYVDYEKLPDMATGWWSPAGPHSARVTGWADESDFPFEVRFEYGSDESYGNVTPWQEGIPVSEIETTIDGLSAGEIVHYRIMARTTGPEVYTVYGEDNWLTFIPKAGRSQAHIVS